jgi:long-chain acyl-CoA synthetase
MKRKLRGFKRSDIELDFNLYRVNVPIPGISGHQLSVIDIQPEGIERTIMLVHGFAGSGETWEHQINHLSKQYRVVVPDLRGHGQSDAPLTRYTMEELVADLHQVSRHLVLPEKFALAGHSFGGSICIEYAVAHPEQLERLILIATAGEYPVPRAARLLFRLPAAFYRPWWEYRPRWNAEIPAFKRMALNNMIQWHGWSHMKEIHTPTLVLTGQRDNYFPRRVYDDVGKTIPGAEIIDIGASKHKVQLERHKAVNRAIDRFLDENKKGGSWRAKAGASDLSRQRPWLNFYSQRTPKTVPIPRRPLPEFLQSAAEQVPKQTAIICYKKRMSYEQLERSANQFAHALLGLGLKPGDRVMISLPNLPQFIVAYYGVLKSGGVVVLSNPDADIEQIIRQLQQTESKILITLNSFGKLIQAARLSNNLREIILVDPENAVPKNVHQQLIAQWRIAEAGQESTEQPGDQKGIRMSEFIRDAPYYPPDIDLLSDELAAILFTSGTTANPKGVSLNHYNMVANAIQTRHWVADLEYGQEIFLAVVPLLHSYGMTTTMNLPIASAATIVLMPVFHPRQVLEHIRAYRPTVFPGAPSMYAALAQEPDARSFGLDSIRACMSGSSPLPVEVQESFEKLTNGRLVEGYGLTEASPVTHANPLDGRRRDGSIGVPIPNTDAKIIDLATGADLPPGQIGELLVKGPQIMQGYWRQPEETDKLLKGGWLNTGDVAVMDVDGFFHVIGRTRDLIRAGEHTVYPRDVEELIYENNKVREVAVVGVPRASNNQKVKVFVVPRQGTDLSKEELIELCRRRLEDYAVPWEIEFRDELPKSFTGKVIRRLLVDR